MWIQGKGLIRRSSMMSSYDVTLTRHDGITDSTNNVFIMMCLRSWLQGSSASSPPMLLLDGGVSTYLEHLLLEQERSFSNRLLWSSSLLLDSKDDGLIRQCHRDFLQAGSDIVSSVTYQCHFGIYAQQQRKPILPDETMTLMIRHGIQLAKEEASTKTRSAVASLGCYGAALADGSEYRGNYSGEVLLQDFHSRKLKVALSCQPDAIAFETIPNQEECIAIVKAIQQNLQSATKAAFWISLGCQNGSQLNDGSHLTQVLSILHELDPHAEYVHAVGINCCHIQHGTCCGGYFRVRYSRSLLYLYSQVIVVHCVSSCIHGTDETLSSSWYSGLSQQWRRMGCRYSILEASYGVHSTQRICSNDARYRSALSVCMARRTGIFIV